MWDYLRKPRHTSLIVHEERSLLSRGVTSGFSDSLRPGRLGEATVLVLLAPRRMPCSKAPPHPLPFQEPGPPPCS